MNPIPEVYYMTVESAKKRNLIIDSVMFFSIFLLSWSFLAILGLRGAFEGCRVTRGGPKGPYE